MLLLATTAIEKMQAVPAKTWFNLVIAVLILIAAVLAIRKAAEINKVVLAVLVFIVLTVGGFHWVYFRNEPRFLSPLVDKIAPFFPSAADYSHKQNKT